MKKLLITSAILIATIAGMSVYATHFYRPSTVDLLMVPKVITKTVTVMATEPVYRVGDTQDGITLIGVYPYDEVNNMAGNGATPPTVHLLYFAVKGVTDLPGHVAVLSTDGTYLGTDGKRPTIPACGDNACISFLGLDQPAAFYYKGLKWTL